MTKLEAISALDAIKAHERDCARNKLSRIVGTPENLALKAAKKARREAVSVCRSLGVVLTDSGVIIDAEGAGTALTHVEEKRIIEKARAVEKHGLTAEEVERIEDGLELDYKSRLEYKRKLDASIELSKTIDSDELDMYLAVRGTIEF